MPDNAVTPEVLTLDDSEARAILRRDYGIEAVDMHAMPSELATVFRVAAADGRQLAFKASRFSTSQFALESWRTAAMDHLESLGVPVARTVPSVSGTSLVVADVAQSSGRPDASPGSQPSAIVHLGQWLEGTPLDSVRPSPELLREVGRTAAAISRGLAAWPAPPEPISHPWELTRTLETLATTMPAATDPVVREVLQLAHDRFIEHVADKLSSLPQQVVHHDLHDSNLLVTGDSVTGVLDFGDMVWAPRVAELVVAGAYASRRASEPVAGLLDVLKGWGTRVPLEAGEIDVVCDSVVARLAVNLSVWTARLTTDRAAYAQSRSAGVVPVLQSFLAADRNALIAEIQARLGQPY
ncbi:phosphotransferase [Gulosibacter molinativorax]|uniref:Hydroxylysine kinase n=1 Tax=Gulosibacter molinativorax TaxID=256821 RepID=A0ABT7C6C2_9MICO|nr:phosphotransferase [Gulosibacter molinativorax]MDJ1370735.1 hypothetical protein [Gulosibacter molinativorax]QUY63239.1 Hypotetical protein [Gulosibacter molinativorax]